MARHSPTAAWKEGTYKSGAIKSDTEALNATNMKNKACIKGKWIVIPTHYAGTGLVVSIYP